MSKHRQSQCEAMLAELERAGVNGVSRKQFAKLLDIKKGNHLNGLIAELLERNLAHKVDGIDDNNRPLFIYLLPSISEAEYRVQS